MTPHGSSRASRRNVSGVTVADIVVIVHGSQASQGGSDGPSSLLLSKTTLVTGWSSSSHIHGNIVIKRQELIGEGTGSFSWRHGRLLFVGSGNGAEL